MNPLFRLVLSLSLITNLGLLGILFYSYTSNYVDKNENPNKPFAGLKANETSKHFTQTDLLYKALKLDSSDIVLTGDSYIALYSPTEIFNDLRIKNRGIHGEFSAGVVKLVAFIAQDQPKQIICLVGMNDIIYDVKNETTIKNYRKIINIVSRKAPKTKLSFVSLLPIKKENGFCTECNDEITLINDKLRKLCSEKKVEFIDVHDYFLNSRKTELDSRFYIEGLHINSEGYKQLSALLSPHLMLDSASKIIENDASE